MVIFVLGWVCSTTIKDARRPFFVVGMSGSTMRCGEKPIKECTVLPPHGSLGACAVKMFNTCCQPTVNIYKPNNTVRKARPRCPRAFHSFERNSALAALFSFITLQTICKYERPLFLQF